MQRIVTRYSDIIYLSSHFVTFIYSELEYDKTTYIISLTHILCKNNNQQDQKQLLENTETNFYFRLFFTNFLHKSTLNTKQLLHLA